MTKRIVALALIPLLMVAAAARAQDADPLSPAQAGVLIPFMNDGAAGDISILEITSLAGANPNMSLTFFDASCVRGVDVPLALTENDLALVHMNVGLPTTHGLLAIAGKTPTAPVPTRLLNPVHSRMYWFNLATNRFRILEPITVLAAHNLTWNPLRTGATFFAPREASPLKTVLYLICPKTTIQGAANAAFPTSSFPAITPAFKGSYPVGSIRARVYDGDELFVRDWQTGCDCLATKPLASLDSVYVVGPAVTYTQLESPSGPNGDFPFTGYKALEVAGTPADLFGRLSSNSRTDAGGVGPTTGNR